MRRHATEATEATLRVVARGFAYPAPPSLVAAVEARLREPAPRGWLAQPVLRFAAAAAAVAVVVLGAALAVPQSRTALADFFGLSNVRIEFDDLVGPQPPALAPEAYARPMSLEDARARADFAVALPANDEGPLLPDSVFVQGEAPLVSTVILVYNDFDLSQSRFTFFGKGVPEPFEEVEVGGRPAIWIAEGRHIAWFIDDQDRVVVESRRLVERATLLWEDDRGVTYRLETSLPRAEAIALAESVR